MVGHVGSKEYDLTQKPHRNREFCPRLGRIQCRWTGDIGDRKKPQLNDALIGVRCNGDELATSVGIVASDVSGMLNIEHSPHKVGADADKLRDTTYKKSK
jgi:hypothetical protein